MAGCVEPPRKIVVKERDTTPKFYYGNVDLQRFQMRLVLPSGAGTAAAFANLTKANWGTAGNVLTSSQWNINLAVHVNHVPQDAAYAFTLYSLKDNTLRPLRSLTGTGSGTTTFQLMTSCEPTDQRFLVLFGADAASSNTTPTLSFGINVGSFFQPSLPPYIRYIEPTVLGPGPRIAFYTETAQARNSHNVTVEDTRVKAGGFHAAGSLTLDATALDSPGLFQASFARPGLYEVGTIRVTGNMDGTAFDRNDVWFYDPVGYAASGLLKTGADFDVELTVGANAIAGPLSFQASVFPVDLTALGHSYPSAFTGGEPESHTNLFGLRPQPCL